MRTDRRASLKWTQRYENATKTVPASCRDPPPHTHTCPKDTLRACMLSSGSETPQLRMHATSRPCFFKIYLGKRGSLFMHGAGIGYYPVHLPEFRV